VDRRKVAVRRDSPGPCGLAAEGESVMTMGDRIRPVKARTFDDGVRPAAEPPSMTEPGAGAGDVAPPREPRAWKAAASPPRTAPENRGPDRLG